MKATTFFKKTFVRKWPASAFRPVFPVWLLRLRTGVVVSFCAARAGEGQCSHGLGGSVWTCRQLWESRTLEGARADASSSSWLQVPLGEAATGLEDRGRTGLGYRVCSPLFTQASSGSHPFTGHRGPRGSPHLTVGPGWPRGSPASSGGRFPSPPHPSEELHNPRRPRLGCAAGDQGPGDRARPSPGWWLGGGWPGRHFLWW